MFTSLCLLAYILTSVDVCTLHCMCMFISPVHCVMMALIMLTYLVLYVHTLHYCMCMFISPVHCVMMALIMFACLLTSVDVCTLHYCMCMFISQVHCGT